MPSRPAARVAMNIGQAMRALLVALPAMASAAHAEHADRGRQIAVTANEAQADHRAGTAVFSGDVVVTQGTLEIHADRVTTRPGANGQRLGSAWGRPGAPVRFRERGDKPGEWSEGEADRVEYDSLANEVRLIGAASLRNLAGTAVTQSAAGEAITYDIARDRVSSTEADRRALQADGVAPAAAATHRTTVVFMPPTTPANGAGASPAP